MREDSLCIAFIILSGHIWIVALILTQTAYIIQNTQCLQTPKWVRLNAYIILRTQNFNLIRVMLKQTYK